jgi:dinuclear metal center YbgI/SA1388 family protein
MTTLAELLRHLDERIPFAWAEPWDRVGLLAGDPSDDVTRVLVSLDPTPDALDRAAEMRASVLLTHHPAFLDPLESVVAAPGTHGVAYRATRLGIALVACHTNLDRSPEGADALPAAIGLDVIGPLERRDTGSRGGERCDLSFGTPLAGRLCTAPASSTLGGLAVLVGERLGVRTRVWGAADRPVRSVALAPGSGRSLVPHALAAGADVLVTGELRYHEASEALQSGLAVIEAGHDATEWPLTSALAEIASRTPGIDTHDVVLDRIDLPWWIA